MSLHAPMVAMADQSSLANAISSLIGPKNFAIISQRSGGQRDSTVLDQAPQSLNGNKIADNNVINQAVNNRNLPRGSLVDIRV